MAETRQAVLDQLLTATHAAATKPLQEAATRTGVKDSLAMPTISHLLAIGKALRRSTPLRKATSISDTERLLREELHKMNDSKLINPLFDMPGDKPVVSVVHAFTHTRWVLSYR